MFRRAIALIKKSQNEGEENARMTNLKSDKTPYMRIMVRLNSNLNSIQYLSTSSGEKKF